MSREQEAKERAWMEYGSCTGVADPNFFFPTQGESVRAAKEICAGCPVRSECLEYALEHGEKHGIWGGLSERERRRVRRSRARAAAAKARVEAAPDSPATLRDRAWLNTELSIIQGSSQ